MKSQPQFKYGTLIPDKRGGPDTLTGLLHNSTSNYTRIGPDRGTGLVEDREGARGVGGGDSGG